MPIRQTSFLTLLGLCLVPLLVLGFINYFNSLNVAESELRQDLDRELDNFIAAVSDQVDEREDELTALARSITLNDYLKSQAVPSGSPANDHVLKDLQLSTKFLVDLY